MSNSQSDQPKQKTPKGLEIPIPKEDDFERLVQKAATTKPKPLTRRGSPKK